LKTAFPVVDTAKVTSPFSYSIMASPQDYVAERQNLMERLLDAVKQCQVRFGGKSEVAADSDSRVVCLCQQFEVVLQHGYRKNRRVAGPAIL
jgi:sorting nexin-29